MCVTSALDGGSVSFLRCQSYTPGREHLIRYVKEGGWLGTRAVVDK